MVCRSRRRSDSIDVEDGASSGGNIRLHSIEPNLEEKKQLEFNELLIENGLNYYSDKLKPTIYSLCKKYGSSRYHEIFQIANMIGDNANPVPYLQVLGTTGTGKYTLVTDFLMKNESTFGCINGTFSKWLCNSQRGNTLHKISIDNLFVRPVEQIRKKLISDGIISGRKKRSASLLMESDPDSYDSCKDINTLKDFIDELRAIKREYSEYLQNNSEVGNEGENFNDGSDSDSRNRKRGKRGNNIRRRKCNDESQVSTASELTPNSRSIFLVVKDVTTLSKNRPDLLLTLMRLHEHLREVIMIPNSETKRVYVNFSVVFIDNNGIPEDFYCNHFPFPIIWFSAYNSVQCFDIIVNSRINYSVDDFDINSSEKILVSRKKYKLMFDSLRESYTTDAIEFVKCEHEESEFKGIKLLLVRERFSGDEDCDAEDYISKGTLSLIWTEYVAEMVTVLHPFLKSDFVELVFKVKISWPVFLFPVITGEILLSKSKFEENHNQCVNELTVSLINRFKRHYNRLKMNIYSHVLPELFQGDLLSESDFNCKALSYSFLKNQFRIEMPYFSKLLLVSAYIASKINKKDDRKLFHSLVASKLKASKSRKRANVRIDPSDKEENKPFSLIRWLAIADCVALHITGTEGLSLNVLIFEQINNIVRLGFVLPVTGKWGQIVQAKGCCKGPLFDVSPMSGLTVGQNMGIEMALFRQHNSFGMNGNHHNNIKLTNIESPVNIEDPRALYTIQISESIIETFSVDIGILLKEVIPE